MSYQGQSHLSSRLPSHSNASPVTLRDRSSSPFRPSASHEQLLGQSGSHEEGSTVPETVPAQREFVTAENPRHARNVDLVQFNAKVVHGKEDDLTFWPTILKPWPTAGLVALYLGTATGIGVLWWRSGIDRQYKLSSENVRMISRYFPSILGTITVLLFRMTVREFIRMTPYVAMADQKGEESSGEKPWRSISGAFFPWQNFFTTPGTTSFISLLCQFLASFIVSLKVALLASIQTGGEWTLTVRFYPAAALIGGYVLMAMYTLFVAFRFRGKSTGLKWDPVSIADYTSLFSHCNALEYFEPLELRHEATAREVLSSRRRFRLGYWDRITHNPASPENATSDRVYGIGFSWKAHEDGPPPTVKPPHTMKSLWYQKIFITRSKEDPKPLSECEPSKCAQGTWPKCEHYPYRHNPGCARWIIALASILVWCALGAAITALVKRVAFDGFHMDNKWSLASNMSMTIGNSTHALPPIDPTDPKSTLLVYALLFRSGPTYIAGLFTSTIIEWVDLNMRFMEPFVRMFESPGDVSENILLAYITLSPLQVPLTAYDKGHYKVSVYSTLSTLSPLFPIFVGGLLTVSGDEQTVHFKFSLSAYIGIMFLLLLYSVALPLAIPLPNRLLPRQFYSMADLMAMCHQARFLGSPHFNIADQKRTPSKQHMDARILLSGDRFLFGRYKGRDDKWHLGFDVRETRKPDYGDIQDTRLVEWVPPEGTGEVLRQMTVRATTSIGGEGRGHYMPMRRDFFGRRAKSVSRHAAAGEGLEEEMYEMSGGLRSARATGLEQGDARPRNVGFIDDQRAD